MTIVPLVTYEALADLRFDANDLLTDVRYWSTRVMGCKEAMPEAYDPEYAVTAQTMLGIKVAMLKSVIRAIKLGIDIFNEHDELGITLDYCKRTGEYDFGMGCGVNILTAYKKTG